MYLTLRTGTKRQTLPIKGLPTKIGRDASCEIRIERDSVSKVHAEIVQGEFGITINDLQSTNGLHINGQKVDSQELKDGDNFAIGDVVLTFHDDEPDHATRKIPYPPNTHAFGFKRTLSNIAISLAVIALTFLIQYYNSLYLPDPKVSLKKVLEDSFVTSLLVFSFTGSLILGSLITKSHVPYKKALMLFSVLFLFSAFWKNFSSVVYFHIQSSGVRFFIRELVIFSLIGFAFWEGAKTWIHNNSRRLQIVLFSLIGLTMGRHIYGFVASSKATGLNPGLYAVPAFFNSSAQPLQAFMNRIDQASAKHQASTDKLYKAYLEKKKSH